MPDNEILQQILAEMKNINERLEELSKTVKHTDKTVQMLSNRPIEHEAVTQEIIKDVY